MFLERINSYVVAVAIATALLLPIQGAVAEPTDQQIAQALIQQSIAQYPGNCPCPYNKDRAGRSCGKRSAYSKPGGHSPLCYPSDVTPEMIASARKQLQ
jgi:hypothetical protein